MTTYVFVREDNGVYLIECMDDASARAQAEMNAGTVQVEDLNGRAVWQADYVPAEAW